MTDHSTTTPVPKQLKGYGKYGLNSIGGYEVGELKKRVQWESDRIITRVR